METTIKEGTLIRYAPTRQGEIVFQVIYLVDKILSFDIRSLSVMCTGTTYKINFETGEHLIVPVPDTVRKFGTSNIRSSVLDGTITIQN